MLTGLQCVSGLFRSSLSSVASRRACPDLLVLSATDTERGSGGNGCYGDPLRGHITGCLCIRGLLFFALPAALLPQFTHLDATAQFAFLNFYWFLFSLLTCWNATSRILHSQSLKLSQCPTTVLSPFPSALQSKSTRPMQEALLTSSPMTVSTSVKAQPRKQEALQKS